MASAAINTLSAAGFTMAFAYAGDARDANSWSGMPAGLIAGLEACGVNVLVIDVRASRAVERAFSVTRDAVLLAPRLRTAAARRRVSRAHGVDAILQLGSTFEIVNELPLATYDDMTVAQYERLRRDGTLPEEDSWTRVRPRARVAWALRQQRIYDRAAVCGVMSEWAAASLLNDYGVAKERVLVAGGGVNLPLTAPADREWSVPRFLIVASDWQRKNVPLVVEAFGAVRARYPESTLDVVGGYPGPSAPGVAVHGILSLGEEADRAKLARLFERATCFVMPSRFEAYGIVYAEAACAGVPSIGTAFGGAPEVVGDGGLVVDPNRPRDLEAAMLSMGEGERARRLGALALTRASTFQWDRVAARLLEALGNAAPGVPRR